MVRHVALHIAALWRSSMKKLLLAASLLAIGATAASAQRGEWRRDYHPYEARYHNTCQEKAQRLHSYHSRAKADGRLSWRERQTVQALERDLDRTCGRYRFR